MGVADCHFSCGLRVVGDGLGAFGGNDVHVIPRRTDDKTKRNLNAPKESLRNHKAHVIKTPQKENPDS